MPAAPKGNKKEEEEAVKAMDETDVKIFKKFGLGPYALKIKQVEDENKKLVEDIKAKTGIKESDTGLALPSQWNLAGDQMLLQEHPLHVATCTKIIDAKTANPKFLITLKQIAKFVVGLGKDVAPSDIEESMRVGVERNKYTIQLPLPPRIDPSVTTMTVEEKPDVTYADVGGAKDQLDKLREVLELPLLAPERFVNLGIDPPKGVLLYEIYRRRSTHGQRAFPAGPDQKGRDHFLRRSRRNWRSKIRRWIRRRPRGAANYA